jgi:hypothetical protein
MSLRSFKALLVAVTAAAALGGAGAAFADDDGPPPDYSAPAVLTPVQLDLAALQQPLRDLVALSEPGAVVTTSLVPDTSPSQILVSISSPDGSQGFDAELDASYIRSLVTQAPRADQREATLDAVRIFADRVEAMRDLSPEPVVLPSATNTPAY